MVDVLKIFNPNDKPFGILSNNYIHYMEIDNTRWKSVTNYIYSNMLVVPGYATVVKNANPSTVRDLFKDFYTKTVNNSFSRSIEKALDVKFQDPVMKELLSSTGTSPIIYWSKDPVLGIGEDKKGQNLLGVYISQIRHRLEVSYSIEKEQKIENDRKTHIYNTYVAGEVLKKLVESGDDLSEYVNLTANEIIDKYGRDKIMNIMPTRDAVILLYKKGVLGEIVLAGLTNPIMLATGARKKGMRRLRLIQINKQKKLVMNMYTDSILEERFPNIKKEQYKDAREQQFDQLDAGEYMELESKLFEIFKSNLFPSKLTKKIEEALANIKVPSEDDVSKAEAMPIDIEEYEDTVSRHYRPEQGENIYIGDTKSTQMNPKYISFSPSYYTSMLTIDNYQFPTVIHYAFCVLISLLQSVRTLKNAYKYILVDPDAIITGPNNFRSPEEIVKKYYSMRDADYSTSIKKYALKGIDEKFTDIEMADVLILTENQRLVWNDTSDPILGVGEKNRGDDYIGKILMQTRKLVKNSGKNEFVPNITVNNIENILQSDPFMKAWFEMRLKDMCNIVSIMKEHVYHQTNENHSLDSVFVSTVLDKIYQPCSALYFRAGKVDIPVPKFVTHMIYKFPGFRDCADGKKLCPDVATVIWKRLAIMLYYLIEYKSTSTIQNIRTIISRVEKIVSSGTPCEKILNDPWKNCILTALINLTKGVYVFNKIFAYSSAITQKDITTATNIILGNRVETPKREESPVEKEYLLVGNMTERAREFMEVNKPVKKKDSIDEFDFYKAIENMDAPIIKRKKQNMEQYIFPSDVSSKNNSIDNFENQADDYNSDNESEYGYGSDNYGSDVDDSGVEDIRHVVERDFDKNDIENVDDVSDMLMEAVSIIAKSKMSIKVKTNRVNFFAN